MTHALASRTMPNAYIGADGHLCVGDAALSAEMGALTGTSQALSVISDPKFKGDLSKPAMALASGLDTGLGTALGLGKSLSSAGTDAIANLAGDLAGKVSASNAEILTSAMASVPMLAQLVTTTFNIISSVRSMALASDEEIAAWCAQLFNAMKPGSTGSLLAGGSTVPADIFARVYAGKDDHGNSLLPYGDYNIAQIVPGDGKFRSAFGMLLMQITEGYPIDPDDFTDDDAVRIAEEWDLEGMVTPGPGNLSKIIGRNFRLAFDGMIDLDMNIAPQQWRKLFTKPQAQGLPPEWRRRFRALRRGIEASYKRHGSDGGQALFVLYIDLLAAAFRKGPKTGGRYMTWNWVEWILVRSRPWIGPPDMIYSTSFWDSLHPSKKFVDLSPGSMLRAKFAAGTEWARHKKYAWVKAGEEMPKFGVAPYVFAWGLVGDKASCPMMLKDMLRQQVDNWQHTIDPYYKAGEESVSKLTQPLVSAVVSGYRSLRGES